MLKINLIRPKKKSSFPHLPKPRVSAALFLILAVSLLLGGCGKSNVEGGDGTSVSASVSLPPMTANFQNQCAQTGGQITTAADGAAVCKYAYSVPTSSGSSASYSCSLFGSQMAIGIVNVAAGDTIKISTSKSVTLYETDGMNKYGSFVASGSVKQTAAYSGLLVLNASVSSFSCSNMSLSSLGVSSLEVDRCLDSAQHAHVCN